MTTQSKVRIVKTRHPFNMLAMSSTNFLVSLLAAREPKGFISASKHSHWCHAMTDEIQALHHNNTWTLVPRPPHTNVIGSKWVFRTKYHADGTIDCYKARLVAQGFTQIAGFDFSHTFSPVVKATTVRIVLFLAVTNQWNLHQLDVKNAFLNVNLYETVYMEQPPGYIDQRYPNHVCRLNKALYALRQAPRAWF
ncbi:retrovirus-related pol polyprotein from transposon RE1 [Tanacetum coccineum]